LENIEGAWILYKPIQAEMELIQSGNIVRGTYHNHEVRGIIEGILTTEGEENILTGKWGDQLGTGDFRVKIGTSCAPEDRSRLARMVFHGNWRHSKSQKWDGVFEGERRGSPKKSSNIFG
jgi:hypothetical protein